MDTKIVCVLLVAIAIVSIDATNTANVNTANTYPVDVTASDTGVQVGNLRSKRQFGFPGGYGNANAFSSATAGAGGYGGLGGAQSFAASSATAGAGGYGGYPYGKK